MNFRPIKLCLLALLLPVLSGCLKEDLSQCQGLTLKFRYTLNPSGTDLLPTDVQDVRVYVFDAKGVLCQIARAHGESLRTTAGMELDLPTGRYDLIAWGGDSDDMMQGGYMDAQMADASVPLFQTPAVVGQTTLGDFCLLMRFNTLSGQAEGDVTPATEEFGELFYGSLWHLDYRKGEGARTEVIDLLKNSNRLRVRINGLNYLGVPSADFFVLGRNGRYCSDNTIGEYARVVRYEPADTRLSDSSVEADIHLLRMDKEFHTVSPILLKIQHPVTGRELFKPIDVLRTLLQVKDAAGNPLYRTQEDFDRQDEYLIEINAVEAGITISVDGWVIGTLEPSVE